MHRAIEARLVLAKVLHVIIYGLHQAAQQYHVNGNVLANAWPLHLYRYLFACAAQPPPVNLCGPRQPLLQTYG